MTVHSKLTFITCKIVFVCCFIFTHEADPQSQPVVITIFIQGVRPSFRLPFPTFQNLAKLNKLQVAIVIATGETVGLAEGIIYDLFLFITQFRNS